MLRSLLCLALCSALEAYSAVRAPLPGQQRTSQLRMGAAAIVAKKAKIVEEVKDTMEQSSLMFCVRSEGITVNDMNNMRMKFDESVTVRCVKNTLVKRAAEDVPKFQGGDSLLEYSNYWFFVPEDHMRTTVDTWNDFAKESGEDNEIVGGIYEGECLDKKGVIAITKLPTKQEQMQTTAMLLKALPTKLARSLNEAGAQRLAKVTKQAAGQKLVQAVKQIEGKL